MKTETREILNKLSTFKGFSKSSISDILIVEWTQETIDRLLNEDEMKKRGNTKISLDEKYESAIASLRRYLVDLEKDTREIETEVLQLGAILRSKD